MTTPQPDRHGADGPPATRGPAGMPAHLWDLACSDVRTSVPERIRGAVANGMNAPEGVRRIAARVAAVGAAVGIPAALVGVGATADGFATSDAPVDLAGGEAPLDGLDPVPPTPGSESADHGPTVEVGPHGGYASQTTTGTGDVDAGMGTTWHVQEPGGAPDEWLTVHMYQDVTVTETADGMFVVDAYQYIVIRDDDGNEYVFKEHYQVVVPDPPGQETDLVIHERGFVHVTENPDGSFSVDTTDHGIDVIVGADGDGRDEVTITQDQGVRVTDRDHHDGTDVTVDLNEKAVSTSKDTGDEAVTTTKQGQVFTDGDVPPEPKWKETTGTGASRESGGAEGHAGSTRTGNGPGNGDRPDPFDEEPADRQTGGGAASPVQGGNQGPFAPGPPPGGSVTGAPAGGSAAGGSAAAGSGAGNVAARGLDAAPLSSTIAVAAPVAATTTWQAQPPTHDVGLAGQGTPTTANTQTAGTDHPADGATPPFAGGKPPQGKEPFEPGTPPEQGTGAHPGPDGTHPAGGTGGTDGTDTPANTGTPGHEAGVDDLPADTTPVEHATTERTDDHTGGDPAHTPTGGDGADHALVS